MGEQDHVVGSTHDSNDCEECEHPNGCREAMLHFAVISVGIAALYFQATSLADVLIWTKPFKIFVEGPYREIASQGLWLAPSIALVFGAFLGRARLGLGVLAALLICPIAFWGFYAVMVWSEGLSIFEPRVDMYSGTIFTTFALQMLLGGAVLGVVLSVLLRHASKPQVDETIQA